jgi:hypothetical protein
MWRRSPPITDFRQRRISWVPEAEVFCQAAQNMNLDVIYLGQIHPEQRMMLSKAIVAGNCNLVSHFVPVMAVGSAGRGAIAAEFGTILPNQPPLTPGLSGPPSSG